MHVTLHWRYISRHSRFTSLDEIDVIFTPKFEYPLYSFVIKGLIALIKLYNIKNR